MKRLLLIGVSLIGVLFLLDAAFATELVYVPVNPSFGGNPANGQWLMNSASAQNKFKDTSTATQQKSPFQSFEDNLNRELLSRLAQKIVDMAFGEGGLQPGTYLIGGYTIDVGTDSNGITVVITDPATGNTSTIQIPYY